MYEDHKYIDVPSDNNQKIWRYIDFSQFISILERESLFFNRSDNFKDPFEGIPSKRLKRDIKKSEQMKQEKLRKIESHWEGKPLEHISESEINKNIEENMGKRLNNRKKTVFLNCWHMNENQSTAMWDQYSEDKGIVIQSTYQKLKRSLSETEHPVHIGTVDYIDFESSDYSLFNDVSYLSYFLKKRKSFKHESEIRAILRCPPPDKLVNLVNNDALKDLLKEHKDKVYESSLLEGYYSEMIQDQNWEAENGIYVNVDIGDLIENIYISPDSEDWIVDLVRSVIQTYNSQKTNNTIDPEKDVIKSNLWDSPLY